MAVVAEDRPQGEILWVNERAHSSRIYPGRRYAEGLALASDLRAGTVDAAEITAALAEVARCLRAHTPEVEPSEIEPGVFWLNASGVTSGSKGLYPSLKAWSKAVRGGVRKCQLAASVVVGFGRFSTYALARAGSKVDVLSSPEEERELSDRVALSRLDLPAKLRDALCALGIEDVGAFRRLPPGGIRERFGTEASYLHRLARGEANEMLAPVPEVPQARERHELEPDQHQIDVQGLLFLCKQKLARLVHMLAPQGQAIAALRLCLMFEKGETREERVSPAEPTLDEMQLIDLLRLRLEAIQLGAELESFELRAETVQARSVQHRLFRQKPKRDLAAGNRALARLRAELGETAVVCAELMPGHLPEARFSWQPLRRLELAQPEGSRELRMVRRVFARPRVLTAQRAGPDGWFVRGLGAGPLYNLFGPYITSGGWWHREQHREYYFAEMRRGDLLWIYFDRRQRVWALHGAVE